MSALRVPLCRLDSGPRELDEDSARYVAKVHRLRTGDVFVAFDPEAALEAQVRIDRVHRGRVHCVVGPLTEAKCLPSEPTWLLLGICKADRFEWALREAVALGVTDIVPTRFVRSASAGAKTDEKRAERWRRILLQGARQCGRGDVPRLRPATDLNDAIDAVAGMDLLRLCLWEKAELPVGSVLAADARGVVLLVGPEGGIEDKEAQAAAHAGFHVVSLGSLVLRTETAVVASLGAWRVLRDLPAFASRRG